LQFTRQILDGLNGNQTKAVTAPDGPLLILAGPGTGKTLTIVRRIAYLVEQGATPEDILVVTFTNRAAQEMKTRAEAQLENRVLRLFIGTFHLLGLKILKETSGERFILLDKESQLQLIKTISKLPNKRAEKLMEKISRVKNFQENNDGETQEMLTLYHSALRQRNAYDFDDLIRVPLALLESNLEIRKRYQERFKHIVVDEYQDINAAQYRLLKILTPNDNICVVGDPDQAIYAFRGADVRNFLDFEHDFPGATKVTLTENYRSTGSILQAAGTVIKNNAKRIDKPLVSRQGKGADLTIISVPDEKSEGSTIVREIERRIGGTSHYQIRQDHAIECGKNHSHRFSDFAVLFRTNAQARVLGEAFRTSGIPYQVLGRSKNAQIKEREETVAYLRSLLRTDESPGATPPEDQEAKLITPEDYFDPRADVVTLMTMHSAKGLEFPVVFIAGCEEGLIPYTALQGSMDIEEERRLYYVGMTRAKEELLILHSRRRFLFGCQSSPGPSPFLDEIPAALVQRRTIPDKKEAKQNRQIGLF